MTSHILADLLRECWIINRLLHYDRAPTQTSHHVIVNTRSACRYNVRRDQSLHGSLLSNMDIQTIKFTYEWFTYCHRTFAEQVIIYLGLNLEYSTMVGFNSLLKIKCILIPWCDLCLWNLTPITVLGYITKYTLEHSRYTCEQCATEWAHINATQWSRINLNFSIPDDMNGKIGLVNNSRFNYVPRNVLLSIYVYANPKILALCSLTPTARSHFQSDTWIITIGMRNTTDSSGDENHVIWMCDWFL